jgi:hypothetical protein
LTAVNGTGGGVGQSTLLTGFNSSSRVQSERGEAAAAVAAGKQCGSWSTATDKLTLKSQECPIEYPRISVEVSDLWRRGLAGLTAT